MELTTGKRPDRPDGELLARAAKEVASSMGIDDPGAITWEVLDRIDRRSSTLYRVRAASPDGNTAHAYFKRVVPPPYEPERRQRWIERTRSGLTRSEELEQRLSEATAKVPFRFSKALAVDPETLSVVTVEVPGEPFGKPWNHLFGQRRHSAMGWLAQLGSIVAMIESCTIDPIPADVDQREAAVVRRIGRSRAALAPETVARLENRMAEFDRLAIIDDGSLIYSHGDLSPTNLLIGMELGLIDFTWPVNVRGFDIAHMAFRIEYDSMAPASWTSSLVRALIEGYGDPGLKESPGWKLTRMTKLLKIVESAKGRTPDPRARRAKAELESI